MQRVIIAASGFKNLRGSNLKKWDLIEFKSKSLREILYIFQDLSPVIEEAATYTFEELFGLAARRVAEAKGLDPWGDEAFDLEEDIQDRIMNLVKRGEFSKLQKELSILPETKELRISVKPLNSKNLDSDVLSSLQADLDYINSSDFQGIEDYVGFSIDSQGSVELLTGI